MGLRARPPEGLAAEPMRRAVRLSFKPNEANVDGVVVRRYEIYRREAGDITGQFRRVAKIPVDPAELSERGKKLLRQRRREEEGEDEEKPRGPGGLPGGGGPPTEDREEEVEEPGDVNYTWTDRGPEDEGLPPRTTYLYKVRTVAFYSYPQLSQFTPPVQVTTLRTRDFRFLGRSGNQLRFEVVVYTGGGTAQKATFTNVIGDVIGGFKTDEDTGTQRSFLTGCKLLDFHPRAIQTQPRFLRGRIIYLDERDNVKERWRRQKADQELWNLPEEREREKPEGPGPGPYGPEGPYRFPTETPVPER